MKTHLLTGIQLAHPDDHALYLLCELVARRVAEAYKLDLRGFEHKRRPSSDGALGLCDLRTNTISIVFRHRDLQCDGGKWHKRRLCFTEILNTIAHELAHLRYPDHGKKFKAFCTKLEGAVRDGYAEETQQLPQLRPTFDPVYPQPTTAGQIPTTKR